MAEASYGVYVSIRNVDGVLVSSFRPTAEEVIADLPGLNSILDSLGDVDEAEAAAAVAAVFPTSAPSVESVATAPVATPTAPSQESTFERCGKCGSIKDKWVPPGTSKKTGRPYPGFYGCSNPNCR